jgi:uncharacterized protein YcnI
MMAAVPRRALAVLAALCAAAGSAPAASAHVVATPAFLPSGGSRSLSLAGPNERDAPMTGFRVTAPDGLVIEHAHDVEGWTAAFDGSSAEWTGGSLDPNAEEIFGVTLQAVAEPGTVTLTAEQLYGGGAVVSWPVAITVTPAEDTPSENLALAAVVGLIGLLLVVAVALLAWRRRGAGTST